MASTATFAAAGITLSHSLKQKLCFKVGAQEARMLSESIHRQKKS